jgi:hypothetical protein
MNINFADKVFRVLIIFAFMLGTVWMPNTNARAEKPIPFTRTTPSNSWISGQNWLSGVNMLMSINDPAILPNARATGTSERLTDSSTQIPGYSPQPQGMFPMAIANTKDGKYAYIDMALPIAIFKVRLEDLVVEAVADLSAYFPNEGRSTALDASENKLFVTADMQRKLLVVDTQTMSVTYTINDIDIIGMTRSQYGPFLITWSGGGSVKFVNTETYEVTEFIDSNEFFLRIQESNSSQDLWYVISGQGLGLSGVNTGIYNHESKTWNRKILLPPEARAGTVMDLKVLPNEHKAYVAVFGGWYPEFHAYGWLHSVDLVSGEVKVVPIDGGASCLEASPDSRWVYVGTDWPIPNTSNLLVVDTQTDEIVDQIYLGQTQYGWHFTQMDDLQIDPAHPGLLYATNVDGNALVKMDLDSLTLVDVLVFNQESFQPHFFVRRLGQATGFIVLHQSPYAFELDLDQATIKGVAKFPNIRQDAFCDIGINDAGNLLIAQSDYFLEVDAEDMHLLETHPLPPDISVWYFILSNDQKMIYSIMGGPEGYQDTFLAINTSNFQVDASVWLEGGNFVYRPFELPDGSKLYALGGQQNGPVVIHVIDTETYTIQKTITFDEPGMLGISAGGYFPFTYDSNSHTLYVGATQVVLAIDTDTDVIKKVIYLGDAARAFGLEPQQLTYFNATGMVYNPQENYLYIAHLDQSFVSIYDLTHDQFLPQAILLNGFFPSTMFASDDYSRMYIINTRSDNISVIDTNSKTEEKVIDLHAYTAPPMSFDKSAPVNGAGSQSASLTLNWAVSTGAVSYEYCYDATNNGICDTAWISTGTNTTAVVSRLSASTTYYWQVRANNTGGVTYANSDTWWSFVTMPQERAKNGGFNTYSGTSKIPKYWVKSTTFASTDGKYTSIKKEGTASVRIIGAAGKVKTLTQTLSLSGAKGQPFNFSYWVKASAMPTTGSCYGQVLFYYETSLKGTKTLKCPTGATYTWKQVILNFAAPVTYNKVLIRFTYSKPSGNVWFDGVSLFR